MLEETVFEVKIILGEGYWHLINHFIGHQVYMIVLVQNVFSITLFTIMCRYD